MQPLIGITTRVQALTTSAGVTDGHVVPRNYPDAVIRAGGLPILLSPVAIGEIAGVVARLDGLLLSGGGDVHPDCYGGTHRGPLDSVDRQRDEFEIALVRAAAQAKLPTLAICRGLQVLNVALGGTLIGDIDSEVAGALPHSQIGQHAYERVQHIVIDESSRLAAILGTRLSVNSIHHQAVRDLAPGLRAVAHAADGVVEAVEHEADDWPLWAVQWHPEYLSVRDDSALALFVELIASARSAQTGTVDAGSEDAALAVQHRGQGGGNG